MIAALAIAASMVVQSGDTLSGIAASNGVSLSSIEAANPQITDPNVISVGETVNLASGDGSASSQSSSQSGTASAPSQPSSSSSSSSSGGGYSIPGMSSSLANCIAFHESTDGQASSNVFQILPSSGYDVSGMSLSQQEQVAGQLYAQYGSKPWQGDGCA